MIRISPLSLPVFAVLATLSLGLLTSDVQAAGGADMGQEYDQVRKIAFRDPRVKEAYEEADRRLDEKIVKLDPALANYVAKRGRTPAGEVPAPAAIHKPAAAAAPAPIHKIKPFVAAPAAAGAAGRTHVVASGETVAGIARNYHVSAASVESANHITDPRKLRAGQTLIIPGAGEPASEPAPARTSSPAPAPAAEPQQDGVWDKLKHSF